MPRLACFGDEIAKDIATQIEVMTSEGVCALELRAAEGFGVLELDGEIRENVRWQLREADVAVSSIGSPVGKSDITAPFAAEQARLARAIEQARFFGTRLIRIFSFFIPEGQHATWRPEVMARLTALAQQAEAAGMVLCHENEARIYGESIAACRDLLETVDSPALRAVHDTANFVTFGEAAFPDGYEAVRPWLEYVHIKDRNQEGTQPAGEGDGRMPELLARLRDDGFNGYLSLEPHIGGGPDNFRRAARALKRLLDQLGWAWS
ncbi:MAG: sugar phosphate isomerase/epimerase [Armatimonadetes bacterium]|nr:sugar phosphate isomerase/epimerase [Armatimonadota bacterium]